MKTLLIMETFWKILGDILGMLTFWDVFLFVIVIYLIWKALEWGSTSVRKEIKKETHTRSFWNDFGAGMF